MDQKPCKCYTPEFKAQTVELLETGKSVTLDAEDLCISSHPPGYLHLQLG